MASRYSKFRDRYEPLACLPPEERWQSTPTEHVWQRRKPAACFDGHAEQLAELIQQARDSELGEHIRIHQQPRQDVPTYSDSEEALDRYRARRWR